MSKNLRLIYRNIPLIYSIRVFTLSASLIVPNLVLYVQSYGVSQDQFFWLETIFAAVFLIMQIPTGRFADLYGKRRSLQVGSLFLPASQLFYIFGQGFEAFLWAEVLGAIGLAFLSGADEAIFYDSLVSIRKRTHHAQLWGRAYLCGFIAMSLGNLVGGLLAAIWPRVPFIMAFFGFNLLVLLSFLLVEPKAKKVQETLNVKNVNGLIKLCLVNSPQIRLIMLFPGVFLLSLQSLLWVYQSYFLLHGVVQTWHGVLIAAFNLVAGFCSIFAFKVEKNLGSRKVFLLPLIIMPASMLMLSYVGSLYFIPLLILQHCIRGFLPSIFSAYFNKSIPTHFRATALSLKSSCELLYYIVLLQVTRILVAENNVQRAFFVHAFVIFLVATTLIYSARIHQKMSRSNDIVVR